MQRATYSGWLLETAPCQLLDSNPERRYRAWVSDLGRHIVGFAAGSSEASAVRMALVDACSHYRKDLDAIAGLETEYFGPMGMLATAACANGGA